MQGPEHFTNVFAAKACQCLKALGSVMARRSRSTRHFLKLLSTVLQVMIVLSLILLTYYTTIFCVFGPLSLSHSSKAHLATAIIVVYNVLARSSALFALRQAHTSGGSGRNAVVELLCGGSHRTGKSTAGLAAKGWG